MTSEMIRGKESLNRIEISRLVQDLLNFGVFSSLWLWGRGRWVGGVWGHLGAWRVSSCTRTCMYMHKHACKCMHRNCKWLPTWRHPCLSCLTCMCVYTCVCAHVCACVCAWDTPYTPIPTPPHPPICHPSGGTPGIAQNSITLELIKIFQFFLKI